MIPRRSFPNRAALGLALAALATVGMAHPVAAADLAPYSVSPSYSVLPAPPCVQLEQSFSEALHSIRQTASLFRSQDRAFHRLKRIRANDGFSGPDISLNAAMTAEQIDVATKVTEVSVSVAHARQWGCFSPARLNRIDNEASRINQQIAQKAFWIDPRTFW